MNLAIDKSPLFYTDVASQFRWYWNEAGDEQAQRFLKAVDMTITKAAQRPDMGRKRRFRHSDLQELRSCQVEAPFRRLLIFYRVAGNTLHVWRLMHGARDLPKRLLEPPI